MNHLTFALSAFAILSAHNLLGADSADGIEISPIHAVIAESGVVPQGTSLVIRTTDAVTTRQARRSVIYLAMVAADILDQNGGVLIPKGAPIELVVRSLGYIGPGGVGMTLLALELDAVTVDGVRYPLEANDEPPKAGGLDSDRGGVKWIGGSQETSGQVITRGRRINVPVGTLLAFEVQAPIRLRGYSR